MNALDTLDAQSTDGAASGRPVAPTAADEDVHTFIDRLLHEEIGRASCRERV